MWWEAFDSAGLLLSLSPIYQPGETIETLFNNYRRKQSRAPLGRSAKPSKTLERNKVLLEYEIFGSESERRAESGERGLGGGPTHNRKSVTHRAAAILQIHF